ncbi:MAG: AAA family ATPase, partial [Gammaproteobacteria bacterium]|nr:AAA family ATPase [Gammaproteobacteria bacterium]
MLRKISIENFYSIKDKQVLDLAVPSNAPDLPCFAVNKEISAIRIPKVVSIFGANASGKTTVLRALGFLKWFLTESFNQTPTNTLPLLPFLDSETHHGVSRFEVEFDGDLIERGKSCNYRYNLEIRHDPGNKTPLKPEAKPVVESESLYFAPEGKFRRLFHRKGEQIKDSLEFKVKVKDYPLQTFRDNASVVPTLVQYNHAV